MIKQKKKAFTLTELLITLTLMGAVLALTIPTLNLNVGDVGYAPALKKVYQELQNACYSIMANNAGTLANSFVGATPAETSRHARDNANMFAKTFEYVKTCDSGSIISGGCWATSTSKLSGGASVEGFSPESFEGAILSDGTLMLFRIVNNDCGGTTPTSIVSSVVPYNPANNISCGDIFVDVNGVNSPNTIGRDIFLFSLGANGVYPGGDQRSEYNNQTTQCSTTSSSTDGYGCAGKVLDEGDINY